MFNKTLQPDHHHHNIDLDKKDPAPEEPKKVEKRSVELLVYDEARLQHALRMHKTLDDEIYDLEAIEGFTGQGSHQKNKDPTADRSDSKALATSTLSRIERALTKFFYRMNFSLLN